MRETVLIAVGLLVLTCVAYLPAFPAGFVWDDDDWITENPAVVGEVPFHELFTGVERLQYYPLLYTVLRLEHTLFGLEPAGYHAVNIVLHALNAVLLGLALSRLSVRGAFWIAALFAIHPVHVESVAWVTELKNVLSGAFVLASFLAWIDSRETGRRLAFGLAVLLFACAMLSKTAVAPFPVVLVLVLLWKRGTVTRADALRLVPFFVVAGGLSAVTIGLESGMVGAVRADFRLEPMERLVLGSRALLFYPAKLLVPWPLVFNYPRWDLSGGAAIVWPAVALGTAAVLSTLWWRGRRGVVCAALAYAAMIFPVLGLFDVFAFRYSFVADHFQYLASVGILILLVEGVLVAADRLRVPAAVRTGAGVAAILALAAVTNVQSRSYRDEPTLWRDTLAKNPDSWIAHHNLGVFLLDEGEAALALPHLDEAVRVKPESAESLTARGRARVLLGDLTAALDDLDRAVERNPAYPDARLNRAAVRIEVRRHEDALADLDGFLAANPGYAPGYLLRARAYEKMKMPDRALADLDRSVAIAPSAESYVQRAVIQGQLGRFDLALADADRALAIDPSLARAYLVRGSARLAEGDLDAACDEWAIACDLSDCGLRDRYCGDAR